MLQQAVRRAALPALVSLFVTLARFFGERAELPGPVTFMVGIFWLTLIVAAFWGVGLAEEDHPYRVLLVSLLVFALLSRIPVVALWWFSKTFGWGTHYDVYSGWGEALVAQFLFGTVEQLLPGGLLGSLILAWKRRRLAETTVESGSR
jgi:hypothetical protein